MAPPLRRTHRSSRPRTSPAYDETLARSARHIVQPQVGLNAMISALGGLKAPWVPRCLIFAALRLQEVSATQKFTPRSSHPPECNRWERSTNRIYYLEGPNPCKNKLFPELTVFLTQTVANMAQTPKII